MSYFNQRQWLPMLAAFALLCILFLAACSGAQKVETPDAEPLAN